MNASIKTVIKQNALSNGNYPIYLRVTIDRKSKFYKTPYSVKEKEWDKNLGKFKSKSINYLQKNRILDEIIKTASLCLDDLREKKIRITINEFNFDFQKKLNPDNNLFLAFFEKIYHEFDKAEKVNTARSLEITIVSLKKYCPEIDSLSFDKINYEFLIEYELFLRTNGCNNGGIGVYMRNIRLVINQAIKRKLISIELYPFREYKISKLKSNSKKVALNKEELNRIINFDLSNNYGLTNAKYTYIFSVLCRGMNFTDLAELKWDQIYDDRFNYIRNKTGILINVKISENKIMKEILDYYRIYNPFETDYIFPILKKDASEYSKKELKARKDSVRVYLNKQLKKLLKECKIYKNITFYCGRHTFATISLKSGVSTEIISQALGHQDLKTTKSYLENFSNDELDFAFENVFQ